MWVIIIQDILVNEICNESFAQVYTRSKIINVQSSDVVPRPLEKNRL